MYEVKINVNQGTQLTFNCPKKLSKDWAPTSITHHALFKISFPIINNKIDFTALQRIVKAGWTRYR